MMATTAGAKRPLSAVEASVDADLDGQHRKMSRVDDYAAGDSSNGLPSAPASRQLTPLPSHYHHHQNGHQTSATMVLDPSRSRDHTPVPMPLSHRPTELPAFPADASIVLTGIRGCGKSTLAIIASTAMKRRTIDCEKAFQHATGNSSSAYKRSHGSLDCHARQAAVLRDILSRNPTGCIIVSSWMERNIQSLLRDFSRTNPVIHIIRDTKAIQEHLKIEDEDKAHSLVTASTGIFRGCSNLEFFNISESPPADNVDPDSSSDDSSSDNKAPPAPYLTLKRAERHFLKFLSLVLPSGSIPFIESAFPLASIPTEDRRFTYAVSVPLSRLIKNELGVEDIETGADVIEVIVDDAASLSGDVLVQGRSLDAERATDISRAIGSLRRSTVLPIVYHIALPPSSSDIRSLISTYMEYIFHGLRLALEYITIDLRLGDYEISHTIASKRRSKVIAHFGSPVSDAPAWQDPSWMSHYHRARSLGCNLVRLIKPVTAIKDNFDLNRFKANMEALDGPTIPLIAYNTGLRGRHSACMNHVLTSVVPESLADSKPLGDQGQPRLTAKQATQALYGSFLFDPMKLYVFGAKVDYSVSPAMHNVALQALGIPHHYRGFSTPNLRNIREHIEDPFFAGASIGLPFKVEIITLTHSLSRHARAIGAVNTLIPVRRLNPDGSIPEDEKLFNCRNRAGPVRALYGENTDWVGIRACLRRGLSPANAVRPASSGLVIGAGGMARAAIYAMLQLGVKNIVVYNRTLANAEKMADHFNQLLKRRDLPLLSTNFEVETRLHVMKSTDEAWPTTMRKPTMIVVCIPVHGIGDEPAPDFYMPPSWLESPTGGVLLDLGYKTLDTPVLKQVRRQSHRGWVTMDGLELIPEQGFAQFELFTGRRAPRRLMRRETLRRYTDDRGQTMNLAKLQPRINIIPEQEP